MTSLSNITSFVSKRSRTKPDGATNTATWQTRVPRAAAYTATVAATGLGLATAFSSYLPSGLFSHLPPLWSTCALGVAGVVGVGFSHFCFGGRSGTAGGTGSESGGRTDVTMEEMVATMMQKGAAFTEAEQIYARLQLSASRASWGDARKLSKARSKMVRTHAEWSTAKEQHHERRMQEILDEERIVIDNRL